MGRSATVTGVLRPRGAETAALEMITVAVTVAAHRSGAGLRVGGASAAVVAGLHPEIGGGRDLLLGTGAPNPLDLSLGPGVVPGPMRGNKRCVTRS